MDGESLLLDGKWDERGQKEEKGSRTLEVKVKELWSLKAWEACLPGF